MKISHSKIKSIIKHEYTTRLKSKGFIFSTLLGPIGFLVFMGMVALSSYLSVSEAPKMRIAIVDYSENYGSEIVNLDTANLFLSKESEIELREKVLKQELDGYLVVPENILDSGIVYLFTGGGGGIAFQSSIRDIVNTVVRRHRLEREGISPLVIQKIDAPVVVDSRKVTIAGEKKEFTEVYAIIGYILGISIYILMFTYGGIVQRSVIEEKANRIIEVLASSAKPFEILLGKVIGVGALGLTQILIWLIVFGVGLYLGAPLIIQFFNPEMMQSAMGANNELSNLPYGFELPTISPWLVIALIFYFLSGYFLFSTIFAAIGSAVDQESDAAQIQAPISMFLVIPMLFISVVIINPDSVLSVVLSLIPFFSPTLMVIRIAASEVPLWQIIISILLMVGSFLAAIWASAKIYRVGILIYGKKPSFKELFKWLRAA